MTGECLAFTQTGGYVRAHDKLTAITDARASRTWAPFSPMSLSIL